MKNYTVEYRRRMGCTLTVGMFDIQNVATEADAEATFFDLMKDNDPYAEFEVIRVVENLG